MELNNDRKFPLILAGHDYDNFVTIYNAIAQKLLLVEQEYQATDPDFHMGTMWTCYCLFGQIEFNVTEQCQNPTLRAKILEIFSEVI